jgi:hypothetical protein
MPFRAVSIADTGTTDTHIITRGRTATNIAIIVDTSDERGLNRRIFIEASRQLIKPLPPATRGYWEKAPAG